MRTRETTLNKYIELEFLVFSLLCLPHHAVAELGRVLSYSLPGIHSWLHSLSAASVSFTKGIYQLLMGPGKLTNTNNYIFLIFLCFL